MENNISEISYAADALIFDHPPAGGGGGYTLDGRSVLPYSTPGGAKLPEIARLSLIACEALWGRNYTRSAR